jgi:hypothetical protein
MMTNFTPLSAAIGGGLSCHSAVLLMLLNGRIAGVSGLWLRPWLWSFAMARIGASSLMAIM